MGERWPLAPVTLPFTPTPLVPFDSIEPDVAGLSVTELVCEIRCDRLGNVSLADEASSGHGDEVTDEPPLPLVAAAAAAAANGEVGVIRPLIAGG